MKRAREHNCSHFCSGFQQQRRFGVLATAFSFPEIQLLRSQPCRCVSPSRSMAGETPRRSSVWLCQKDLGRCAAWSRSGEPFGAAAWSSPGSCRRSSTRPSTGLTASRRTCRRMPPSRPPSPQACSRCHRSLSEGPPPAPPPPPSRKTPLSGFRLMQCRRAVRACLPKHPLSGFRLMQCRRAVRACLLLRRAVRACLLIRQADRALLRGAVRVRPRRLVRSCDPAKLGASVGSGSISGFWCSGAALMFNDWVVCRFDGRLRRAVRVVCRFDGRPWLARQRLCAPRACLPTLRTLRIHR